MAFDGKFRRSGSELVKLDCDYLLGLFQKTESVRFEVFTKIWKETKFSEIFHGTLVHENRPFSRLVLRVAYTYFVPPHSFQIRVGGLYLLYCLYFSQRASPPEKIHIALKDWGDVKKFERDAVEAHHYDIVYILRQLMHTKAFYFSAMPMELSFKKYKNHQAPLRCEKFIERASRPQELISIELLDELSNVHSHYDKLKGSVFSESEHSSSSVNLIQKDLVPQLRSTVVDFHTWQQKRSCLKPEDDSCVPVEESGEGTASHEETNKRAQLLASIKTKAYGQATEASKSRRHRQVELELSNSVEAETLNNQARPNFKKRTSLKSRICDSVHISGDIEKATPKTTVIYRLVTVDSEGPGQTEGGNKDVQNSGGDKDTG
ncbi:snRNA-activating protein complex subunit 1b [Cynoglossus semilaevis]|uniref:Small nuclear RNA activating complex, polypeptide 1b n=1 Tax=Cynoglossus semilaevis TaxID=244447 RepID=A0A3P8W3N4_CYNSE|nr:snRNA-activating protein complex subunit 1 [Cynoglossus semilaevis]